MSMQKQIVSALVFFLSILPGIPLFCQESEVLALSHPAGSYREDIPLSILPTVEGVRVYFSFVSGGDEPEKGDGSWILYREPLMLSALPGEERFYLLRVRAVENQFSWETVRGSPADDSEGLIITEYNLPFLIDKRPPRSPRISIPSGEYNESLELLFDGEDQIHYAVNQDIFQSAVLWDGNPVHLPLQKNGSRHYLVQVFTKDNAGNRSPVESFYYDIRALEPQRKAPLLKVLSPAEGRFANYQLLFIQSKNLRWIRYTLDGSDPVDTGVPYKGPRNLILTGKVTLSVAAETITGRMLREKVHFEVNQETGSRVVSDVHSGVYDHSLKVGLYAREDLKLYYNYSNRTPGRSDLVYTRRLFIKPIENTIKYTILRVRPYHSQKGWGEQYRFFYVLNDRNEVPGDKDQTTSQSGEKETGEDSVGHTVREEPVETDDRILVEQIPAIRTAGPVVIKAQSEKKRKVVYEIAFNASPPMPTSDSPAVPQKIILSVPFGLEGTFSLRFASVGTDGSITHLEKPVAVQFDAKPPRLPEFSFPPRQEAYDTGFRLALNGEGTFEYELTDDGTVPPDPTEGSSVYRDYIRINGRYNSLVSYYLKLRCRDELGNISETFGPFLYRIDLREPQLPLVSGVKDGAVFNKQTVTLSVDRGNVHVHYTVSDDGSEPPEPTVNSPLLEESTNFTGQADRIKTFRVKLLPFSQFYQLSGKVTSLSFGIDLQKPGVPTVSGISDGGRYNQPVMVVIQPRSPDDTVYVSYSREGTDPPDPVSSGIPYTEPLSFDCAEGREVLIEMRIVALSKHGNRSEPDLYTRFTLDKLPPLDPKMTGIPESGVTKDSLRVGFEAAEGKIYFSYTDDGSTPRLPQIDPKNLFASLTYLPGREGQEVTYRFAARAVDDLGNTSQGLKIHSVTVDRKIPSQPVEPEILDYWDGESRKTIVSWNVPVGHRLYYSMSDENGAEAQFELYSDSFNLDLPQAADKVAIRAYLEDPAGNRSTVASFVSHPERKPRIPVISGVRAGDVLNSRVLVNIENAEGVIRYELSTDNSPPSPVGPDSPEGRKTMIFDVDPGESIPFSLRIRTFHPNRPELSSDPVSVSFVIDKDPPLIPTALALEDNGYYLGSRVVRFEEQEGQIFYTLSSGENVAPPALDDFKPYDGEFNLEGQEGSTVYYRLEAYAVDAAGNRSRSNIQYGLHIDRKGIYVSSSGDDDNEGTRVRPFRSIQKGLDYLHRTGRKILYLSVGNYNLRETVTLDRDVMIQGGLDSLEWSSSFSNEQTIISAEELFEGKRPLIRVDNGNVTLRDLTLLESKSSLPALVELVGGSLELASVSLLLRAQAEIVGIDQSGGHLSLRDCLLEASEVQRGTLISSSGGTIAVQSSVFKGPEASTEFNTVELHGVSESVWKKTEFLPGSGKVTRAIFAENSALILDSCLLVGGDGSKNAVGLDLKNSELKIRDSVVRTSSRANYSVGLLTESSQVVVEKSWFLLEGRYGTIGIKTKDSNITVTASRFQGKRTLEFLYLVNQEGGEGYYDTNIFEGGKSKDSVSVFLTRTGGDWYNNTVLAGTGTNTTHGFHIRESGSLRFVNNILVRRADAFGKAFYVIGTAPQEIRTNCLFGWQSLFYQVSQRAGNEDVSLEEIEALNYLDTDRNGGPFHKNIQESPLQTFDSAKNDVYRLASDSRCIDGGTNVGVSPYNGPTVDIDGESRPALHIGTKPQYDIGADEYH